MKILVQLFAGARELAGSDTIEVDLADGATYEDLSQAVTAACPALTSLVKSARFASGSQYVPASQAIDPTSEIALIPPVSGG